MLPVPNALVKLGGVRAFKVAVLLVAPVPPLVELTVPVVLGKVPAAFAVTLTISVQLLLVARVRPESETLVAPATGANVPPTQVPPVAGGVATTRFAGNVSLKATPVSAALLAKGLVTVKVSE